MKFKISVPMAVTHIPVRARNPRVNLFTTMHEIDVMELDGSEAPISAVVYYKREHAEFRFAGGRHYSPVAPVGAFKHPSSSAWIPTVSGLTQELARHMTSIDGATKEWRELAEPVSFQVRQHRHIPNQIDQRRFEALRDLKELENVAQVQHEGLGSIERGFVTEFSESLMICEGWLWKRCPEPLIWAEHGNSQVEVCSLVNAAVFEVSHLMAEARKPMGAERLRIRHPYFDRRWSSFHSILEWPSIKETSKGQGRKGRKVIRHIEILLPDVFDEPVIEREVERSCVNVGLWANTMLKRQRQGQDIWLATVPANIRAAGDKLEQYRDRSTSEQVSALEDFMDALMGHRPERGYMTIADHITEIGQRFDASDIAPDFMATAFVPCR